MHCSLLRVGYDVERLITELNIIKQELQQCDIAELDDHHGIKGWSVCPLFSINGEINLKSNRLENGFTKKKFRPTKLLKRCLYIKSIIDEFNTTIYYVRMANLQAGCYIVPHKDIDATGARDFYNRFEVIRLHIPIITNSDVTFGIEKKTYSLEPGNLYYVRTGDKEHWVRNKSQEDRFHLIMDLKPTSEMIRKLQIV